MTFSKNKITGALLILAGLALIVFGFTYSNSKNDAKTPSLDTMTQDFPEVSGNNPVVALKTTMGDIVLELYMDRTPITAGNFLTLAKNGFYNGTKFHRVIENFMIQGGDPNTKTDDVGSYGRGGPGYTIEDEFDPELSNLRGTIAMANIGQPNTGGSQFFINQINNIGLDFDKQPFTSKHPVFGHVLSGMEVVDAIAKTPVGPGDLPLEDVVIKEVIVLRDFTPGGAMEDTVPAGGDAVPDDTNGTGGLEGFEGNPEVQ